VAGRRLAPVPSRLPGQLLLQAGSYRPIPGLASGPASRRDSGRSGQRELPAHAEQGGNCPPRRNRATAGQQFSGVVEQHHAITQQAPALFGVNGHGAGGVTVRSGGCRAPGKVTAPRGSGAG
jgi:hypothetical protein